MCSRPKTAYSMARRRKSLQSVSPAESSRSSEESVQIHLPNITLSNYGNKASVQVFGSPCRFCGQRFGRYSLSLHMKKCQSRDHVLSTDTRRRRCEHQKELHYQSRGSKEVVPLARRWAETAVSMSPPLRTRTRSLERSVLVEKGFTLPSIECSSSSSSNSSHPCKTSGETVSEGDALLYQKSCRPQTRTVAKGNITFPLLRQNDSPLTSPHLKKMFVRRPPTVVCYICGREYGSKSISIHEPQCLKKFELENRKLPIGDRKPLPQKSINHTAIVLPITTRGYTLPQTPDKATGGLYHTEILQDTADQYFQYCYNEWEKDLIPCKTCGRTFAPERHAKHVHRCKAKPLQDSAI